MYTALTNTPRQIPSTCECPLTELFIRNTNTHAVIQSSSHVAAVHGIKSYRYGPAASADLSDLYCGMIVGGRHAGLSIPILLMIWGFHTAFSRVYSECNKEKASREQQFCRQKSKREVKGEWFELTERIQ